MRSNRPAVLLLGCGALLGLFVLCGGAVGIGSFLWYQAWQHPEATPLAQADARKPMEGDAAPKQNLDSLPPHLQRVKDATVQVVAVRPDGKSIEGSGFFIDKGVIVTNAHVLGMLDPMAAPPSRIDVIIDGGGMNERTLVAKETVDRGADLAILRVAGANLPLPLALADSSKLTIKQKVHVAGYPLGRKDKQDVTITATEVSDLRRTPAGVLVQIQVNGGMSPGSSGGPVVDDQGKCIGVALGAVKDTDFCLAIPAETLSRLPR